MQTKIDLCSAALLKLGEKAIAGFSEDTAAAAIAGTLYDAVVNGLLCLHPWRFATKKYRLPKTTDGNFLIPPDVLRVLSCDRKNYEIIGNRIAAHGDEIEISAVARAGAETFPAYFSAAAITKLAAEFSIPLTGNKNTFAILNALFENELGTAKFLDSSSVPHQNMGEFALISSRF